MSGRAYVLMTAMPPTKGHKALIEFAMALAIDVEVIVATQPGEPFEYERVDALRKAFSRPFSAYRASINHIRKVLPQEPTPEAEAEFWDMWAEFLRQFGIREGDYIVASEMYGQKLAEITGTTFIPYDLDRDVVQAKATSVRNNSLGYFDEILPEFQRHLRKRITVFGAESTGKTTLSRALARDMRSWWLPEWARPYLESVGPEITEASMTAIWKGQRALQMSALQLQDRPLIVQDTDLFSTLGYWQYSEWAALEDHPVPYQLVSDALKWKSDLYIITRSNIPFEHDQLRYGGDHREIQDQTWIDLCERFELNYVVLEEATLPLRITEARRHVLDLWETEVSSKLAYQRQGKEYENVK